MRNQKGFTLIELIMVIVILGILAAVVVPKFFDFTTDAHKSNVEAFIGNFKSALEMKAAENIVDNGYKTFPKGADLDLTALLDQIPSEWAVVSPSGNKATLRYSGDTKFSSGVDFEYECTGANNASYTLTVKTAAYGWSVGDKL